MKICPTIIEVLTFNKWSKFTVYRSVLSYLWSMDLIDVSIHAIVALAKQKQTKVVFRKRLRQLMNNHAASLEITVNVHEY